jgi:hypothetical protein
MLCTIIQRKVAKLDETGAKATGETQKYILNLDVETFTAKRAVPREIAGAQVEGQSA